MGVEPVYKMFEHDGVRGPNMATVRTLPHSQLQLGSLRKLSGV